MREADKGWEGTASVVAQHVRRQSTQCLDAYRANPLLIDEHANIERATAQGGYGRRQIYELVQNGADAMLPTPGGKIHVLLTTDHLYCANEGAPIDLTGVDAILSSHLSVKRGNEIGRFGLGFKSVLGVTSQPQFFSRSGSFGFNAGAAEQRIRQIKSDVERTPILRLASPLDSAVIARQDPTLRDLMSWATTVVRLPLEAARREWLAADIANFPGEFLLFAPHVGGLVLEDRDGQHVRHIQVTEREGLCLLSEGEMQGSWRVFRRDHVPSPTARDDAGELADRATLPVIWAVQIAGRSRRGQFWAFFPTEMRTTLSGILNAPWKTNEDRQNLLKGTFNEELIGVAADLIVESLPKLVDTRDPGSVLELLPARGREAPQWADELLTEAVYARAESAPAIPDQSGALQLPSKLWLHPSGVPREALVAWSAVSARPQEWCHSSIETRDRRSRVERLVGPNRVASYSRWLEALVSEGSAAASIAALRVARQSLNGAEDAPGREALQPAQIVLNHHGALVAANPRLLFLGDPDADKDVDFVHPEVQAEGDAITSLHALGITAVAPIGELRAFIARSQRPEDVEWSRFWELARSIEPTELAALIHETRFRVRVRNVAGAYRPVSRVLIPGLIVPGDGSRDMETALDLHFHEKDMPTLEALGVSTAPRPGGGSSVESWFRRYESYALARYDEENKGSRRPNPDFLEFEARQFVGPLEPLGSLSDEGRRRFVEASLEAEPDLSAWTFAHRTQRDRYPVRTYPHPLVWLVREQGVLSTSLGSVPVSSAAGPDLSRWSRFFPVAELNDRIADVLELPDSVESISRDMWDQAVRAAEEVRDASMLGDFYAMACNYLPAPPRIACRIGDGYGITEPSSIVVVTSQAEAETLARQGAALLVTGPEGRDGLVARWGLQSGATAIRTRADAIPIGDPVPLIDEFPGLEWQLKPNQRNLILVRCAELRHESHTVHGKTSVEADLLLEDGYVYWRESPGASDLDMLRDLNHKAELGLSDADLEDIHRNRALRARSDLILRVRQQADDATRLLAAVPAETILRRLPAGLISAAGEDRAISDAAVAELALAIYGVDALREFRTELQERGLNPPVQWSGSRAARKFVQQLGFPVAYAGFEHESRDALVRVHGPAPLPPLHDFQVTIKSNVQRLLRDRTGRRALLSLPTGAGKTRIAVEALTEAIRSDELRGPILWIAQTDELCEQAVQTWSDAWRSFGSSAPLSLGRLWASNEVDEYPDGPQVVVATTAKLNAGVLRDDRYNWLSRAACVVIDEAHGSTSPHYTSILEWVGLGRARTADRCPLIGLTATPFRGSSEEETLRLVHRYNDRRLDFGALGDDQYGELQAMGVLAQVEHRLLEGSEITLTERELEQLEQLRRLPARAEAELGEDTNRNTRILDSISGLPSDWTVLLFATSVEHAELLAALLTLRKVPAAVISAKTDSGARRHYIREFRAGRLRVLTNYGVLTEGFDAPAVRAVFVTRPTFSPNVYQQMIGRGLRGPRNGGKDVCLIVNVADNVRQFGQELAFRRFEHLWKQVDH